MEKSGEPYMQFQNEPGTNTLPSSSPYPIYNPPQHNFSVDNQIAENVRRTKRLATVEMITSCILLLAGIISTILGSTIDHPATTPCIMGTSIWAPIFGIITAGLGLGALRYGNYSRSCLLVSHFVMCIITALASGILVIFTCVCISNASFLVQNFNYDDEYSRYWHVPFGVPQALIAFEVFILIGALINLIANIVSTAFICQYWCGRKNAAGTTVVYIPSQGAAGNGPMQAISLPPGSQVIFLPSNNAGTQGAHVPVQTHVPA